MLERFIRAVVHGRYLVESPTGGTAHGSLVGFHGYGENADRHLDELRRIPVGGWRLVSVQALHPFYNQKTNEVMASWMTRLDRERAIADNTDYVAAVVDGIGSVHGPLERLVFAGFSQGVAMAYRAAVRAGAACHGIIALAGDIPPELQTPSVRLPPVLIARGVRDTWYTDEVMGRDVVFLGSRQVPVETVTFEGGHEWTDEFRAVAARFLQRIAGR